MARKQTRANSLKISVVAAAGVVAAAVAVVGDIGVVGVAVAGLDFQEIPQAWPRRLAGNACPPNP
eukprot:3548888-Pyramimonas_sp.AAC.1